MASRGAAEDARRTRIPPLQTNVARSARDPATLSTPPSRKDRFASAQSSENTPDKLETPKKEHQRFVLTDPVAFRYLEGDPSTSVLERRQELPGYEVYIVEQWATSRTHPTFVITTYTGDPSHSVIVSVLSVPSDESTWSPRLRVYFRALNQYHARRETTSLGTLMVTNLASFPSSLTVIPVPDGDLINHRNEFFVNEDLKRLGCSGRTGLTLAAASASSVAKFQQLYHTSDKNDFNKSVVELVRLCQMALNMFDKLEADYADGLLCDVTEYAISDWWNDIGREQYGVEPHDGILGPTTVAAILGLYMGARNRLHAFGAPVAKDPFDLDAMKRGISSFQKQQRLPRTRRLDRTTLDRLLRATAKAAASEGWTVPRAVKSTVAELSGRGGEMISDVVGRRDKAGIAEIETTDFEHFVQLSFGERCKWLWQGKPMKKTKLTDQVRFGNGALSFQLDQHGGFAWTGRKHTMDEPSRDSRRQDDPRTPGPDSEGTDDDAPRRGLRKRATNLRKEAKSGFDKIKGAVMHKDDSQKSPKEGKTISPQYTGHATRSPVDMESESSASPFSGPTSPMSPINERMPSFSLANAASPESQNVNSASPKQNPVLVVSSEQDSKGKPPSIDRIDHARNDYSWRDDMSITGSNYEGVDLEEALPNGAETQHDIGKLLRRTISDGEFLAAKASTHEVNFYPKHLSFSLAEDSVLPWDDVVSSSDADSPAQYVAAYAEKELSAARAKHLRLAIDQLRIEASQWTQEQLRELQNMVQQAGQDQDLIEAMHQPRMETLQSLNANVDMVLRSERERLEEGSKELETLAARLKYEIDELKSRIEDVGNVVDDYERGVGRVEDRVTELEHDEQSSGPLKCRVM